MKFEHKSQQSNLFDYQERMELLAGKGGSLDKLNAVADWEIFREPILKRLSYKDQSKGGRRPKDPVLMFKMCVLQQYFSLSDEQVEYQVMDRFSFQRFLDLTVSDPVPDARTLWLFKENLGDAGVKELFDLFNDHLAKQGLIGKQGRIVDATFMTVPIQRNSRDDNDEIKNGQRPESFDQNPAKGRQKDTDARWVKKNQQNHFGYKDHVASDIESKIITAYEVTPANVHDSQVLDSLLEGGQGAALGDSAYDGENADQIVKKVGMTNLFIRKGARFRQLTEEEQLLNRRKSKLRVRVEHVFGWQSQRGMHHIRSIGLARAKRAAGWINLVYNLFRFECLRRSQPVG